MEQAMSGSQRFSSAPPRRAVASYGNYQEAQRAVDYLSDQKFPVERVAIVGEGLRLVEQVTGRLDIGRAALSGAGSGAITGAVIGFIFGLFNWITPIISGLALALAGLILGAIIGLIFGLIAYALSGGRRDFTSVSGMQAERYNVTVDEEVAAEADRLLAGLPVRNAGAAA